MINKDDELEGYVRIGANCDFLEKYNEFVEISAQKIRELLLDPKINNIRMKGAVITDTLDLRDTLSSEGSPAWRAGIDKLYYSGTSALGTQPSDSLKLTEISLHGTACAKLPHHRSG
ncbi:MAG: hypothetical protein DYH15_00810 [Nitrosomonas sp. PRO4]|nr:hypothetical protein [Nitrosomonas sp. PRO4]